MRIPLNSCKGCNEDALLCQNGMHRMENGDVIRCEFIKAELIEHKETEFVAVSTDKIEAIRIAKKKESALLYVGQGLHPMWLVVREK